MNSRMDPESKIGNISKDVEQSGDFRGARGERVFFCAGGPGTPGTPGSAQAELAGFSSMLRYATLRFRFRFALLRFAFASLCFRFAASSNSKSITTRFRQTIRIR